MPAKYYIYRNLTTGGFSVKYKGTVVARTDFLIAFAPTFKVNKKGRQRVIKSGQKSVHAYVVLPTYDFTRIDNGIYYSSKFLSDTLEYRRITYEPFVNDYFKYVDTGERVTDVTTMYGQYGELWVK